MGPILRARIAGQSGLVTRAQALSSGYTRDTIAWRLDTTRWVRIHPGVYQTNPGRDDWETRAVAVLLHAGLRSALWGPSAGHVWGLVKHEPTPIHVVIPAQRRVRPVEGAVIRRSRTASDRIHPSGWPHRIVAEHTVWDLAHGDTFDRAVSLAAKAIDLEIATAETLSEALEQRPRQSHRGVLREALADVADGAESTAEVRYVRDVERAHDRPGLLARPRPDRLRARRRPGHHPDDEGLVREGSSVRTWLSGRHHTHREVTLGPAEQHTGNVWKEGRAPTRLSFHTR